MQTAMQFEQNNTQGSLRPEQIMEDQIKFGRRMAKQENRAIKKAQRPQSTETKEDRQKRLRAIDHITGQIRALKIKREQIELGRISPDEAFNA